MHLFPDLPILALALGMAAFRFYGLRWDYAGHYFNDCRPYKENWGVHHDEKLTVPDARFFYLRGEMPMAAADYGPWPPSSSFGFLAPFLQYIGFRIFGFNNVGLRVGFALISGLTDLVIAALLPSVGSSVCTVIAVFIVGNVNNFFLGRHGVVENLLPPFLLVHVFWCALDPEGYRQNLYLIAFLSGLSVFCKPNFPIYVGIMIASMTIATGGGVVALFLIGIASIGGIAVFEVVHSGILAYNGVLKNRFHNLRAAFLQHKGAYVPPVKGHAGPPPGLRIVHSFFVGFIEWFLPVPPTALRSRLWGKVLVYSVVTIFIALGLFSLIFPSGTPVVGGLFLFFVVIILKLSLFFFCMKRAINLYPILLMYFGFGFHDVLTSLASGWPWVEDAAAVALLPVLMFFLWRHANALRLMVADPGDLIRLNSLVLERMIPTGSTVYIHCHGYRFLWTVRKLRLISCDDQFMDNEMIAAAAIENGARYLVLTNFFKGIPGPTRELGCVGTGERDSDGRHICRVLCIGVKALQERDNFTSDQRQQFQQTISAIRLKRINRILDIGCGTGKVGECLREKGFTGVLHGLDLDDRMDIGEKTRLGYAEIYTGELLESLRSESRCFDAVFMVGVMYFLSPEYSRSLIAEIPRILAPGGLLVTDIEIPNENSRPFPAAYCQGEDAEKALRDAGFAVRYNDHGAAEGGGTRRYFRAFRV